MENCIPDDDAERATMFRYGFACGQTADALRQAAKGASINDPNAVQILADWLDITARAAKVFGTHVADNRLTSEKLGEAFLLMKILDSKSAALDINYPDFHMVAKYLTERKECLELILEGKPPQVYKNEPGTTLKLINVVHEYLLVALAEDS